ncbi:MAG: dihydropteroate synthase [Chloroflexota bacterium]|nr:dihydropteroate synthase [Chloroflexota bacterium]
MSRPTAAELGRYNVRPLTPGPESALRDAVLALGGGPAALPALARHGRAEAVAVSGLAPDECRVLVRELRRLGGEALTSAPGDRAVLLGPLSAFGDLPSRLVEWGRRTEVLGAALQAAIAGRGSRPAPVAAGGHVLRFDRRTLVMGIVNATPDSFSGDGTGDDPADAVARGVALAAAGADIVDVGGESTRPGSTAVTEEVEVARVVPVVRELAARLEVPVSVDTRKAAVARAALEAGAVIVNDIWGLRRDPGMAAVVAGAGAAVVVMHNQAEPEYVDVVEEVCAGLHESLALAEAAGIERERVIVDPGLGFGKTPAHNLELLRRLGELRALDRPLMVGPSRKSTIGVLLGGAPPERRLEGTLALCVLAAAHGADLVRVHDVGEVTRALRVADAVLRGTPEEILALPRPGPTG